MGQKLLSSVKQTDELLVNTTKSLGCENIHPKLSPTFYTVHSVETTSLYCKIKLTSDSTQCIPRCR